MYLFTHIYRYSFWSSTRGNHHRTFDAHVLQSFKYTTVCARDVHCCKDETINVYLYKLGQFVYAIVSHLKFCLHPNCIFFPFLYLCSSMISTSLSLPSSITHYHSSVLPIVPVPYLLSRIPCLTVLSLLCVCLLLTILLYLFTVELSLLLSYH